MIELAAVVTAISYIAWGVIHHARRGDLHTKVVLEYLSIALLGIAIVYSMTRFL